LNLCFFGECTFEYKTFLAPKIDVIGFHTIRQSIEHFYVKVDEDHDVAAAALAGQPAACGTNSTFC
jgi:hypothetical protein